MALIISAPKNRILGALPAESLASISPKLSPFPLVNRHGLYERNGTIDYVYFPETGMISLVRDLDDGARAEVGIIGREGVLGLPLLAGIATSFPEAMVQMPGHAWRMSAADFRQEVENNAPLRLAASRYGEAAQAQVMQTAACNGRHGLEQRLARWLLMAHDCADGSELMLTQEFLAMMLGVHRPSLTVSAGVLQRSGLIRYGGGRLNILDRANLEAASCECYGVVRERYRLLCESFV